jgi:xanthine/uracil permease
VVLKINIKETIIGVQYLFVAFGATVLVPLLVGLDPSIALFAAGFGTVTGKDYIKEPGLHRTMLGDGIACMISGLAGGPPVTTYSEVTGANNTYAGRKSLCA